jgi:hypothetical protein
VLWFQTITGLEERLIPFTVVPALILSAGPFLVGIKSWFRGLFVSESRTPVLAQGTGIYTLTLFALVAVAPLVVGGVAGATVAAVSLIVGFAAEDGYLIWRRNSKAARPAEAGGN